MLEFYLTILDSLVQANNPLFQVKFNNLVYADDKLSSDEKFFLLAEMQKRNQKFVQKLVKSKSNEA